MYMYIHSYIHVHTYIVTYMYIRTYIVTYIHVHLNRHVHRKKGEREFLHSSQPSLTLHTEVAIMKYQLYIILLKMFGWIYRLYSL